MSVTSSGLSAISKTIILISGCVSIAALAIFL